jgi:hypothetical protein
MGAERISGGAKPARDSPDVLTSAILPGLEIPLARVF